MFTFLFDNYRMLLFCEESCFVWVQIKLISLLIEFHRLLFEGSFVKTRQHTLDQVFDFYLINFHSFLVIKWTLFLYYKVLLLSLDLFPKLFLALLIFHTFSFSEVSIFFVVCLYLIFTEFYQSVFSLFPLYYWHLKHF